MTLVEEVEQEQEDIDKKFEKVVKRALTPSKVHETASRIKDTEDSYKSFRTGLVYSWLVSNIILIIGVTSDDFMAAGVGVCVPFA